MRKVTTRLVRSHYLRVLPLRPSGTVLVNYSLYESLYGKTAGFEASQRIRDRKLGAFSNDIENPLALGFLPKEGVDERSVLARLGQEREGRPMVPL